MPRPLGIKIGERSGKLVILAISGRNKLGNILFKCLCDCGRECEVSNVSFRVRFQCIECSKITGPQKRTKHGASRRGNRDNLYIAYKGMLTRCQNQNCRAYRWYGAKGIKVCEEWQNFAAFREWALANGYQKGLTLDRIDETLDYSPNNCRYITKSANSARMRETYHFVKKENKKFEAGITEWL